MKTIRCTLTKKCQIFVTFTESFNRNMGKFFKKKIKKEFLPVNGKLYARLYHCICLKL